MSMKTSDILPLLLFSIITCLVALSCTDVNPISSNKGVNYTVADLYPLVMGARWDYETYSSPIMGRGQPIIGYETVEVVNQLEWRGYDT